MADAPPPSRYTVVERDRRLVVIDTWAEDAGARERYYAQEPSAEDGRAMPMAMQRTAFDGRSSLTTLALYDDKGPRTVALDPQSAAFVNGAKMVGLTAVFVYVFVVVLFPVALVALPVALSKGTRSAVRKQITAWLDRAAAQSNNASN